MYNVYLKSPQQNPRVCFFVLLLSMKSRWAIVKEYFRRFEGRHVSCPNEMGIWKQRQAGPSLLFCTRRSGICALLPMAEVVELQHFFAEVSCLCYASDIASTVSGWFFLKLITLLLLKTGFGRGAGLETSSDLKAEGAFKRAKKLLESRSWTVLGA